jgi:uroporphyrinogen-III synthase
MEQNSESTAGGGDGTGLAGRRIVISRSPEEAQPLAELVRPLGATLTALPLIRIEPPGDPAPMAEAATHLTRYDWVVVTSAHAARALAGARPSGPWPEAARVAAIGEGTARALAAHDIPVALVPPTAHGASLVTALAAPAFAAAEPRAEGALAGRRILFPRSNIARRTVPEGLRAAAAVVDEVEAYRTRPDPEQGRELVELLRAGRVDALVLTSPSSTDVLAEAAGAEWPGLLQGRCLVSIGPTTSGRLVELGRPPDAEACRPGPPGILAAIRAALG